MTDRPIIFSAPMVRALIDGRKTQTRRLLNPQPETFMVDGKECEVTALLVDGEAVPRVATGRVLTGQRLRYAVGDRLYVREAWSHSADGVFEILQARMMGRGGVIYRADDDPRYPHAKFWPSIHMPREFSRLTLIVEDVRVERLQAISEADAVAEGATCWVCGSGRVDGTSENECACFHSRSVAIQSYQVLWNSLHDKPRERWDDNPFVVAVSFSVVRGNIDQVPA